MDLSVDGDVDDVMVSAMHLGLASMGVEDSTVVVTADFDGSVRRLTGEVGYISSRGYGVVSAKTLVVHADTDGADDQVVIVVNGIAVDGWDEKGISRLLAHEGGHVLLHRRRETVASRQHLALNRPDWTLLCLASYAVEEMRIERTVVGLGYPPWDWGNPDQIAEALFQVNYDVVAATLNPANQTDPIRFAGEIVAVVDRLSKLLGYLAGYVIADQWEPSLDQLDEDGQANWRDYVEPTWDTRVELYRELPAVDRAIDESHLDTQLLMCAELDRYLMKSFGFEYTGIRDDPCNALFVRLADTDGLFDARLDRANRQLAKLQQ